MTEPVLSVRAVAKTFGRVEAVKSVSFTVAPGEFVGLVGPNGAGKSTTIKMLSGQLLPSAGAITVGGIDVTTDPNGARSRIGYVPEEPRMYEYLTAREMVSFAAEIRGGGDVEAALELAGLGGDADRLIREYSQGMRRRTALAAALVARPPLLVLDEALNGLDPPSAARVVRALQAACADGQAVLLSTHVLDTLERIADRVIMLAAGEVLADVPASELDRVRGLFDPH
jgi:ABC-2 type transport system ATP-binding protein